MIFVFPMAGLSSRFSKAGYAEPKYKLPITSQEDVFDRVISPFLAYKETDTFLFCYRDISGTKRFLEDKIKKFNLKKVFLKELDEPTSGQAETVFICCTDLPSDEELLVFNIDTFHLNFKKIEFESPAFRDCAGVIEVFQDSGINWSFALVNDDFVLETAEKTPISNLASNGLYYFRSVKLYMRSYEAFFDQGAGIVKGERYIAPMYNYIINNEGFVKIKEIEKRDLIFCGTPNEYENCLRNSHTSGR